MNCSICRNGICGNGFTEELFNKNGKLIILKNLPALICDNCGAKFFDETTSKLILSKLKELKDHDSELEIVNLKAA